MMEAIDVRTRIVGALMLTLLSAAPAFAQDLKFHAAGEGTFTFDTGEVRGKLVAQEKAQGVVSLVDTKSGKELAHGGNELALLSVYRLLSTDHRWGRIGWEWPKEGKVLDDGGMQTVWPGRDDHPIDLTGIYRWSSPHTLDLELTAKLGKDAPKFEVFLASYFSQTSRAEVYLKPGFHGSGEAALVPADVSPLTIGTYLAFPRDRSTSQLFFDGRWEKEPHPVQWSITRQMAGPVAVQRDSASGATTVLMARPEDCFGIDTPYNMTPPDGVAGHHSTYLSLFGKDVKAGETVKARLRMIVGHDLKAEKILEAYQSFAKEK